MSINPCLPINVLYAMQVVTTRHVVHVSLSQVVLHLAMIGQKYTQLQRVDHPVRMDGDVRLKADSDQVN